MSEHEVDPDTSNPKNEALEMCLRAAADFEAKWKRALADYQNREKDIARERVEFAQFCSADVIRDFLSIVDAVESSVFYRHSEQSESPTTIGVEGFNASNQAGLESLQKLCHDFLKRHGVEPVGVIGDRIDYLLHEVVGTKAGDLSPEGSAKWGGGGVGTIIEVVQIGYMMHGRLLRPAKVIVSVGEK